MKRFKKFIVVLFIIEVLIIIFSNIVYTSILKKNEPELIREEENGQIVYRVIYNNQHQEHYLYILNFAMVTISMISIVACIHINRKIIKPFSNIKEIPYELAKGNLNIPLKEEKSKYFGKFTWGMDMLRENLEDNKKRELNYQKEKKTLILSLSHDIKTPLSAIKLYTRALKDNLYDTEEKKMEVIEGIQRNTSEIEHYVNEIVKNSREDFLELPVKKSSFYMSEVIDTVEAYYIDKLQTIKTKFVIDEYNDCMINGDKDRYVEVLQNIIENAIKYGDGEKISISFSDEEDCKLVSVTNTGCSIKEDELPHIFDSFYRGSNTKNQEGSGLGLYICRQLMLKMDGDIYAKITNNNTFSVTIVARKC